MTTVVLAHPNQHCPRFQVFGVYDGEDDRFVFDLREFEEQERAERCGQIDLTFLGGSGMLVLSRKKNESIVINDDITIVVIEIRGDKVRLGVEAPKEVPAAKRENFEAIQQNELAQAVTPKARQSLLVRHGLPCTPTAAAVIDRIQQATLASPAEIVEAVFSGISDKLNLPDHLSLDELKARLA